jgi:hypothetical protein
MTNVSSKEAIVLAYLARHHDISEAEWRKLSDSLTGAARELATKLAEAKANKNQEQDPELNQAPVEEKTTVVRARPVARRSKELASA